MFVKGDIWELKHATAAVTRVGAMRGIVVSELTFHAQNCLVKTKSYICICVSYYCLNVNTLRPKQHGRLFPDDILKWIFLNQTVRISIRIALKFVPRSLFNNIPALIEIMAWRRPGDKPLSETMMVSLPTHICVRRPQWVSTDVAGCWIVPHGRQGLSSYTAAADVLVTQRARASAAMILT